MQRRIGVDPNVHFGKLCVGGTRLPVQDVLELVEEGVAFAEITQACCPDLQMEDIRAGVQYALDLGVVEDIHSAAPARQE